MKFCSYESNNPKITGLLRGLNALGHEILIKRANVPLFDIIHDMGPDVLLLPINGEVEYIKKEYPNIKLVLLSDNTTTVNTEDYDLSIDIGTNATHDMLHLGHLADDIIYGGGVHNPMYATEVLVLSDYLNIGDKYVTHILNTLVKERQLKIYGSRQVPLPHYLGALLPTEYKHAIASAKCCLSVGEEWVQNSLINNTIPYYFNIKPSLPLAYRKIEDLDIGSDTDKESMGSIPIKTYTEFATLVNMELEK